MTLSEQRCAFFPVVAFRFAPAHALTSFVDLLAVLTPVWLLFFSLCDFGDGDGRFPQVRTPNHGDAARGCCSREDVASLRRAAVLGERPEQLREDAAE